jgi:four helix bundle protein
MKSAELRVTGKKAGIQGRTFDFSVNIARFCRSVGRNLVADVLVRQLLKAGTSVGANVHEAQGAQSKADFIAKISIAHKEIQETLYWLRLVEVIEVVKGSEITALLQEAMELRKIIASILLTSKKGKMQDPNS